MATFDNLFADTSGNKLLALIASSLPLSPVPPMPTPAKPLGGATVYADTSENQLLWIILHRLQGYFSGGGDGSGGDSWKLDGNAPAPNAFLGTTNAQPLLFKQEGDKVAEFLRNGNLLNLRIGAEHFVNMFIGEVPGGHVPAGENNIIGYRELVLRVISSGDGVGNLGLEADKTVAITAGKSVGIKAGTGDGEGFFWKDAKSIGEEEHTYSLVLRNDTTGELKVIGGGEGGSGDGSGNPFNGLYWKTGGNSAPGTTSFVFGSVTTNDISFIAANQEVMQLRKTGCVGIKTGNVNSTLEVFGSLGLRMVKEPLGDGGSYSITEAVVGETAAHTFIFDYAGIGSTDVYLPDAANCPGRLYIVKRTATSNGGDFNLLADGGGVEEPGSGGISSGISVPPKSSYWYQSDGTDWLLLLHNF